MQRGGLRLTVNGAGFDAPTGAFSAGQFALFDGTQILGAAASGNLTVDTDIYVNSSTGNDANNGSVGSPFQTLSRAWTERLKYSELRAKFYIHLVGAGPYDLPLMGNSVIGNGGLFVIEGDLAQKTVAFTGTFTGDISGHTSGSTVNTSAGLGVNTHAGKFVRITSGTLIGAEFQIAETTNTSITPINVSPWDGGSTVNGDTFEVFTPLTVVQTGAITSGLPIPCPTNWRGGYAGSILNANYPGHVLRNIKITGTAGFRTINADVTFSTVWISSSTKFYGGNISAGNIVNGFPFGVGPNAGNGALAASGIYNNSTQIDIDLGCSVVGIFGQTNGTWNLGTTTPSNYDTLGLLMNGTPTIRGGYMRANSGKAYVVWQKTLTMQPGSLLKQQSQMKFAVTSGDALLVQGGTASMESVSNLTGGTTAGAGFGTRCRGPGSVVIYSGLPPLTGGTLNNDIKTDNTAAAANGTLAAAGNALMDPTNGGVIGRI